MVSCLFISIFENFHSLFPTTKDYKDPCEPWSTNMIQDLLAVQTSPGQVTPEREKQIKPSASISNGRAR